MIPKSVPRFSEQIMRQQRAGAGLTIRRKVIPLWLEPESAPGG
jgi:hypothetical protein